MIHSTNTYKNNLKLKTFPSLMTLFIVSLFVFGCSSDDTETDTAINVEDVIRIAADENLQSGESIGTINATSNSPMTFTILEQVFTNALVVNSSTGELTVGDASFFDFETNPFIQGVIEINNGTETVSSDLLIELNNNDDILFSLTDSKQDYRNAQAGDWIEITELEYERLTIVINDVTEIGPVIDGTSNTPSINGVVTLANLGAGDMPNRSLVFAFKYFAVETQLNSDRHRVKQSNSTNNTGFENIGNPLPAHEMINGVVCFVMKGSEDIITSNKGFLGFQKSSGSTMGLVPNNGRFFFSLGEATDLIMESNGSNAAYQGLSTTQRQWD